MESKPEASPIVCQGTITGDPALEVPIGGEVRFLPKAYMPEIPGATVKVKNWDIFEGCLIALHFKDANSEKVDGSGVIVAPGIALCALHVIKPYLERLEKGLIAPLATAITPHGLQIWRLNKVTVIPDSDLCILGLVSASTLPPENLYFQTIISARFPKIGERLSIVGFRAELGNTPSGGDLNKFDGNVHVSTGVVSEQFPEGRDKVMLPFSTVAVNCPSVGGMSGGPVFNQEGRLVGLLTSSMSEGPSYISAIWPALLASFEGGWPAGILPQKCTFLELDPRLCAIEGREAFQTVRDIATGLPRTAYNWQI